MTFKKTFNWITFVTSHYIRTYFLNMFLYSQNKIFFIKLLDLVEKTVDKINLVELFQGHNLQFINTVCIDWLRYIKARNLIV